jgi:hypothetical protein
VNTTALAALRTVTTTVEPTSAVPEIVGVASFTRALFAGAVSATAGGAVSTVKVRGPAEVVLPARSVATTVSW